MADAGHAGNDAVLNREVFFVVIGGLVQFALGVDVSVVEAFVFGHLDDLLRANSKVLPMMTAMGSLA